MKTKLSEKACKRIENSIRDSYPIVDLIYRVYVDKNCIGSIDDPIFCNITLDRFYGIDLKIIDEFRDEMLKLGFHVSDFYIEPSAIEVDAYLKQPCLVICFNLYYGKQ